MSHLETAAATRACEQSPSRATHFVGSIGRSMTVLDTAVDLSRGDRTDGPARAQFLLVCEAIGDEGTRRRLNAMAIDSITRELLRDDDWMIALGLNKADEVSDILAAAVRTASTSLAAFQPDPDEEPAAQEPVLALTVALVAWPQVAVAHSGDGAVVHLAGERVLRSTLASPDTAAGLGGESPPEVEAWSAELGERDLLILATSAIRRNAFGEPDRLGSELLPFATAKEVVDHLLTKVIEPSEAAIAVAKLSDGVAGQMQTLAEHEAIPPEAKQESAPKSDAPILDRAPLIKDGVRR